MARPQNLISADSSACTVLETPSRRLASLMMEFAPLSSRQPLSTSSDDQQSDFATSVAEAYDPNTKSKGSTRAPGCSRLGNIGSRRNASTVFEKRGRNMTGNQDTMSEKPFLKSDKTGTEPTAASHSTTNFPFPPLPTYGPSSFPGSVRFLLIRFSSFILSLSFLAAIVVATLSSRLVRRFKRALGRWAGRNSIEPRPFYEEEIRRENDRRTKELVWEQRLSGEEAGLENGGKADEYAPTEGGIDLLVYDVGYYARRVGLDVETLKVETEDGFVIDLWHLYDPKEYHAVEAVTLQQGRPNLVRSSRVQLKDDGKKPKFPVLLVHGLFQSAGAFCCNDDESLAFWLCKSGYDVWLGNNRCGWQPQHRSLDYGDARMWCWDLRQMAVYDLPALTCRVLEETGFAKAGLVCHSQGTAETFVALAKNYRPELGHKLTVFCALAPAVYAGPLLGKWHFKLMRMLPQALFRLVFGIHAFIPAMTRAHSVLNPRVYGWLGYRVFSYLFDWTDLRWDRGLRDRMFQFAPVYVSAESMRWWLGGDCFSKHKCILATQEGGRGAKEAKVGQMMGSGRRVPGDGQDKQTELEAAAWYGEETPPFGLWVCGKDELVDGRRLLRRFANGQEPHAKIVHSKLLEEFEHLDVIWAIDAVDQVFKEVREVLWKTCDRRDDCRVPEGCEAVAAWEPGRD